VGDCQFRHDSAAGLWICTQCGWVYPRNSAKPPRRNCPNAPDLTPVYEEASHKLGVTLVDVKHYGQAIVTWSKAGWPTRSQEEVERIFRQHCKPCENNIDGRCKLCRCCVNTNRIALRNKIKMATEHCPREDKPW